MLRSMERFAWKDSRDEPPSAEGWYPVMICWEVEEGFFPGSAWFDGKRWDTTEPVILHGPSPCASAEAAREWACAHDIEA
jgi:hypothetical protein